MRIDEVQLKPLTAAQGLACDVARGTGEPEQFAEYCVRLVAAMTAYTIDEVRQLPDGVIQQLWERCQEQRDQDQADAVKNFETPEQPPSVSVMSSGEPTPTSSSPRSANGSSTNGSDTSDDSNDQILQARGPVAAEAALTDEELGSLT